MRHYFRYKGGYVNVDDENIYLTTTGNWQETAGLKEHKKNSYLPQLRFLPWGIYLVFICMCVYWQSYILLIIITASLGIDNLFGKTNAYRIPLLKVTSIDRVNNAVILEFCNEAGEPVKEKLKKVSEIEYHALVQQIAKFKPA